MSAGALDAGELRELCVDIAVTLDRLTSEADGFSEGRLPLPANLNRELEERDALAAALKTLPEDLRARIRTVYVRCLADAHRTEEQSMPDAIYHGRDEAERMLERVRRAAILDRELHVALGEAGYGS